MSQGDLAALLGVTRQAVGSWEAADDLPEDRRQKLAEHLDPELSEELAAVASQDGTVSRLELDHWSVTVTRTDGFTSEAVRRKRRRIIQQAMAAIEEADDE